MQQARNSRFEADSGGCRIEKPEHSGVILIWWSERRQYRGQCQWQILTNFDIVPCCDNCHHLVVDCKGYKVASAGVWPCCTCQHTQSGPQMQPGSMCLDGGTCHSCHLLNAQRAPKVPVLRVLEWVVEEHS